MEKENLRKVAGLFMIGLDGLDLKQEEEDYIREYQPGGIILFARNYESPAQVAELISSVQELREDIPFLISVDHEGGRVQRFKNSFTHLPPALNFGKLGSPKVMYHAACIQARELAAVGVNLDFTPVCDINTNPANPVIGDRAYGDNEEIVSKMTTAAVRGFHNHGVWSCAKHFPGHGDTSVDSHFGLPRVDTPVETMLGRELAPFYKTFRAKVEMVMMAHIINPHIDPELPASLSSKTISEFVRDKGRFDRLVCTDDMEMKAVADHWGLHDASILAINAGCDMVIYRSFEHGTKAIAACAKALEEGRLSAERLEDSFKRVVQMKKTQLKFKPVYVPEISKVVGLPENRHFAEAVARGQFPHGFSPNDSHDSFDEKKSKFSPSSKFKPKPGQNGKGKIFPKNRPQKTEGEATTVRSVNADLKTARNNSPTTLTGKVQRTNIPKGQKPFGKFRKPQG